MNGLKMEKYYVMGSSLLVAVCEITPLAAGQFGPYGGVCWFSNPDPVLQMRWLVGAQSFWILFMALSELVCFVILASYMIHHIVRGTQFQMIEMFLTTVNADIRQAHVVGHLRQNDRLRITARRVHRRTGPPIPGYNSPDQ
jgi:hypothetical protein